MPRRREVIEVEVERIPKKRVPHRPTKVIRPKKGGGYRRAEERRKIRREQDNG